MTDTELRSWALSVALNRGKFNSIDEILDGAEKVYSFLTGEAEETPQSLEIDDIAIRSCCKASEC